MHYFEGITTPIGRLHLVSNDEALLRVYFANETWTEAYVRKPNHPILLLAKKELREYFTGKRKTFSVPLHGEGTEYQKNVWQVLRTISYGETISYKEEARRAGNDLASRAVGSANGKNPLPIFVPCHRVIASNGKLGGYKGGESVKERLLTLERKHTI